jgi:hypothetical protein
MAVAHKFGLERHPAERLPFLMLVALVVRRVIQQGLQAAQVAQARWVQVGRCCLARSMIVVEEAVALLVHPEQEATALQARRLSPAMEEVQTLALALVVAAFLNQAAAMAAMVRNGVLVLAVAAVVLVLTFPVLAKVLSARVASTVAVAEAAPQFQARPLVASVAMG